MMAESMEKPPPYAPPEASHYGPPDGSDPKVSGYGSQSNVPPTQFMPPGAPGPYPGAHGPYPGPQYPTVHTVGQPFPNYGSTVYVHQPAPTPQIILVGGCPACRIGVLEDDFTCLGVCLAILFFPLGILCCLAMRQRRCPNCGAIFGS